MHFTESHGGSNASKDASPEGRMKGASPSLGKAGNFSHCQPMHFQTPLLLTVCLYLPHYQRTNLSRALETSRRSPKEDRPKLEMFILFQTTSWFSFAREHFFGGRSWAKLTCIGIPGREGPVLHRQARGSELIFENYICVCVMCMYGMYVCECTHVPWSTCGGQKTTLDVRPCLLPYLEVYSLAHHCA